MPKDIKKVLENYKKNLIRKKDLLVENPDKPCKTKIPLAEDWVNVGVKVPLLL